MKKSIIKFAGAAMIVFTAISTLTITSCKKNDDNSASTTITTDDAADAVTDASVASSNGIAEEATMASTYAAAKGAYSTTSSFPCGVQFDTSFTRAASGTNGSYSYVINWGYLLTCGTGNLPSSLAFSHNMHGAYSLPKMTSNDSATGALTISGLSASAANVTMNGTYTRNGSQTSKVRNLSTFTSQIVFTLNNVTVSKSTQHINGGSAAVSINGAGINGGTYSYTGSITFTTTGTATLVINGTTYTITLY